MYVYIYIYIYTNSHAHIVCVCLFTFIYRYTHIHIYIRVHKRAHQHQNCTVQSSPGLNWCFRQRQEGVFIPLTVNNLLPSVDEARVAAIYLHGVIKTVECFYCDSHMSLLTRDLQLINSYLYIRIFTHRHTTIHSCISLVPRFFLAGNVHPTISGTPEFF